MTLIHKNIIDHEKYNNSKYKYIYWNKISLKKS
jgi:hypothetical protein